MGFFLIDRKDIYMEALDKLVKVILGNEEWDAYHSLTRLINNRMREDGYEVYMDEQCKHHYRRIES